MATPASPAEPTRRASAPPMALLHGGRIVAANPPLIELSGYTRSELTSPEFQMAHLFAGGTPPLPVPPRAQETSRDAAVLEPLRGPPVQCARTLWRLDDSSPPALVMLLEPGVEAEGGPMPHDAAVQAAREIVRACSSHLADVLGRLRRAQIQIELMEHAHVELLVHEMSRLGGIIERLHDLEDDVEGLTRIVGSRR